MSLDVVTRKSNKLRCQRYKNPDSPEVLLGTKHITSKNINHIMPQYFLHKSTLDCWWWANFSIQRPHTVPLASSGPHCYAVAAKAHCSPVNQVILSLFIIKNAWYHTNESCHTDIAAHRHPAGCSLPTHQPHRQS